MIKWKRKFKNQISNFKMTMNLFQNYMVENLLKMQKMVSHPER